MDEKGQRDRLFARHSENQYFHWGLTAFIVIALCIILAQFVSKLGAVFDIFKSLMHTLAPVIYGLGIAYLLDPIVIRIQKPLQPYLARSKKLEKKSEGLARAIGVVVAMAVAVLLAWALISMVLPQLLDSVNTIIGNLPSYYNTLSNWVTDLINDNLQMADYTEQLMDAVYNYLTSWLTDTLLPKVQTLVITLTTSVVGVARALLNLVIGIIISIYLLMDKKQFLSQTKKLFYGLLGERRAGYVLNVCSFANHAFGGFIGGKILDSMIIGVISFVVLSIMKMPYAMLISVIVGVTNIIPFFGPFLGAIPSALLLLVIDPMQCLYFIIFVLILQQVDGNIIGPMILGDATGLSGFWVVVSILVFGNFFGVVGMIIAVPMFAVIYKIITEIVNWLLVRRGLSTAAVDYEKWNYPPRPHSSHWRRPIRKKKLRAILHRAKAPESKPAQNIEASEESQSVESP